MSSANRERLEVVQQSSASSALLARILKDYYNSKIKGKPTINIRQDTEAELDSILRHFMVMSYQQQANKINDRFKALRFYDLGQEDNQAIDNALHTIEDKFYFKINEVENRNQGLEFNDVAAISIGVTGNISVRDRLDPYAYIAGVANAVAFGALSLAVKTVPPVIISKVEPKKADQISNNWIWKYLTRNDNNVCDNWERACRPLHNREFEMLDPNTPNPPFDRHIHCRCTMVLIKKR